MRYKGEKEMPQEQDQQTNNINQPTNQGLGDGLGDRMKRNYENRSQTELLRRMPVIIRLDGKAFHTLLSQAEKPFDSSVRYSMVYSTRQLLKEVQGAKGAFIQSDEVSVLLTDYDNLRTDAWFDYNIQKMVSISAAIMSVAFTWHYGKQALFDSRAFNVPISDVCNYFIWRQKDWFRNSVQMLTRSVYSHKECQNKSIEDMHEMLHVKNVNWANLDPVWKNGTLIVKIFDEDRKEDQGFERVNLTISDAPIFTVDRTVIEDLLLTVEEREGSPVCEKLFLSQNL